MAKSARASSRKANNQRLKKTVFGPVEAARLERLSAKLLEVAKQPKPVPEKKDEAMDVDGEQETPQEPEKSQDENSMDIDMATKSTSSRRSRGKIEKRARRKGSIVFPKSTKKRGKSGKK